MASSSEPEEFDEYSLEDDYYAHLNLEKNASAEEITNSYRKFSLLYHPDKHIDPIKKKNAEILFNKTKIAYEVLSDPHQRAIYDTLGVKGLETEGWQIVERMKSPQEIREEYQLLLEEREERALKQRTNPKGTISVGINATDLFESYDFHSGLPSFEVSSMSISQSVEAPLSLSETLVLNGGLSTHNGNGSGSVTCNYRKMISFRSWLEGSVGVGNGFLFTLKGFRSVTKRIYCTVQSSFHFVDSGLVPGVEFTMARQLNKEVAGYLTWKIGKNSSVNTTIVRDAGKGHLVFTFNISPKASLFSLSYARKFENDARLRGSVRLGLYGVILEYSCDKKISKHTTIGASMMCGKATGITLKIKVSRANQSFVFPILLSEEILPSAIFYGTVAPIIGYHVLKAFFIDPYHKREKRRKTEKEKEKNAQRMAEKRKESAIAVSLMQETYKRIKSEEEALRGLVITKAVYGFADDITKINLDQIESNLDVLDVTVQLQCLVKDSRLILPERPKCNLPGFYDPCFGEDKLLRVDYSYKSIDHSVTVKDNQLLRIPRISDS